MPNTRGSVFTLCQQTLCVCGTDHLKGTEGETVYENCYVIWGPLRWGIVREYEVYEDTQRGAALDDHLDAVERRSAGAVAGGG